MLLLSFKKFKSCPVELFVGFCWSLGAHWLRAHTESVRHWKFAFSKIANGSKQNWLLQRRTCFGTIWKIQTHMATIQVYNKATLACIICDKTVFFVSIVETHVYILQCIILF